jgi:hypothetical protein
MSSYFGDVVYTGKSTNSVKEIMKDFLTQQEAKDLFGIISPINYINKLKNSLPRHFIVCGTLDTTFRYSLTQEVFQMYNKRHIPFKKIILPLGHFTLGAFPVKYYLGACIMKYLIQNIGKCSLSAWIKKLIISLVRSRRL